MLLAMEKKSRALGAPGVKPHILTSLSSSFVRFDFHKIDHKSIRHTHKSVYTIVLVIIPALDGNGLSEMYAAVILKSLRTENACRSF